MASAAPESSSAGLKPWPGGLGRLVYTIAVGGAEHLTNAWDNVLERVGLRESETTTPAPLNGKVCLITGSNAGIGLATAKLLAQRGAHVIMACRNVDKANDAAKAIAAVAPLPGCLPPKVEVATLDLANLSSVRTFAAEFNSRGLPLDVLVCNAGLMSPGTRLETKDGLEMQFQVNFLSHWLLTNQLMAEQRRRRAKNGKTGGAPPRGANAGTRVLLVASLTHLSGLNQWHDKQSQHGYSPFFSYAFSKLANVMAAKELQRRFDRHPGYGQDVAVAVHPGIVDTALAKGFFKNQGSSMAMLPVLQPLVDGFVEHVFPAFMKSTQQSARLMVAAIDAPPSKVAGKYMSQGHVAEACKSTEDRVLTQELWDLACQLTGTVTDASLA